MDGVGQSSKELLLEQAPDNLLSRYGLMALEGMENTPAGMWNAVKDDIHHPLQTAGMVAGAAAMGAILKTVLPKAGTYGRIAGLAIGAYVTYRAAEPALDSFRIAGQAKTMNDINVAGKLLGNVAGSFAVNSAISGLAYHLGSLGAARYIPIDAASTGGAAGGTVTDSSPPLEGNFWTRNVEPRLPMTLGITTASSGAMMFEPRLAGIQKFVPSEPIQPDNGQYKGRIEANTELSVTVQLKSRASEKEMDQVINEIALGKRPNLTDKEFAEQFGASQQSLDHVTSFAKNYGLKVSQADLTSGRVVLSGTAEEFSNAFKTQIDSYKLKDGLNIRDRSGALFVPKNLADDIVGVYGLDNLPQAKPHNVIEPRDSSQNSAGRTSYRADAVAKAYNFPKDTSGKGQSAAIVELGGGIDLKNESSYYKDNGLKVPDINVITINGAKSSVGRNLRADGEVSLDSQIIGTVAPDAKQSIIFTSNNEQGFIDAIARGTFPKGSEAKNQAMSISWGQPSERMSEQGKQGMDLALKKAALKGMSVFVAAGDDGAGDNVPDGKLHVDFPASDQYVTATGGTSLRIKDGKIESEVAWNDSKGATGGGISTRETPAFQQELKFQDKPLTGRGEPDIAGNASPNTGYQVRVDGNDVVSGGTSAVAPLYTALALRLNEGLGGGNKTVGFMNPFLYQQGLSGKAPFFNDITQGNNNGLSAAKGWDPVSGWGSLDGQKLLLAYKQAGK